MLSANFGQIHAELALLRARIAHPQPVLALIGAMAKKRAEHEIESGKHDPDGHPWAPWSDGTHGSRQKKGNVGQGLLWDSGTLLHSMYVQTNVASVVIGSEVDYAHWVQDGTRRMPARQFLGWGDAAEHEAEQMMVHYLEGLL